MRRRGITQIPTFGGLRIPRNRVDSENREVAEIIFDDFTENLVVAECFGTKIQQIGVHFDPKTLSYDRFSAKSPEMISATSRFAKSMRFLEA